MSDTSSSEKPSLDSKDLGSITKLSLEELYRLEKEISNEFKSTSKKYVESRLSRIYHMNDELNRNIKEFSENEKNWLKIFNFEIETINNIKTNTEDLILSKSNLTDNRNIILNFDEYEKEVQEIFKSLRSPLEFDEYLSIDEDKEKLPFQKQFSDILKPYIRSLKCLMNEKSYQEKLINRSVDSNSVILWKECYRNIINKKNEYLSSAYEDLYELHKEYYNINSNKVAAKDWTSYHRSVVSPSSIKKAFDNTRDEPIPTNHDIHTSAENSYFKNKVELTNIKRSYLDSLTFFEASQQHKPNCKRTKLNSCTGLTSSEIDNDLSLIRSSTTSKKNYKPELETKNTEEIVKNKETINGKSQAMEASTESESGNLMKKYKKLLSETTYLKSNSLKILDASPLQGQVPVYYLPDLPPLESFPELNRAKKVN